MAFVEVSDPELVREAYVNGLLYEERKVAGRLDYEPIVPAFGWGINNLLDHLVNRHQPSRQGHGWVNYKFYICLEE